MLGVARTGGAARRSSGDIVHRLRDRADRRGEPVPNDAITPLFCAAIEATEEAIVNALLAAETMTGRGGATPTRSPTTSWQT